MKLAEGMVAVVTGGASGIGLALSEALLARGLNERARARARVNAMLANLAVYVE